MECIAKFCYIDTRGGPWLPVCREDDSFDESTGKIMREFAKEATRTTRGPVDNCVSDVSILVWFAH